MPLSSPRRRYFAPVFDILESRCLLTAGAPDPTFGINGVRMFNMVLTDSVNEAALQSDGKIVVGGSASVGGNDSLFAVARLTTSGDLDPTFGTNGRAYADFHPFPQGGSAGGSNGAWGVAMAPDGKIVLVGEYFLSFGDQRFAVARFNADGTLDNTFDGDGMVTTSIGTNCAANCVAVDADGRIVVGGWSHGQFAVVRYNVDGSLDGTFGTGGIVVTPMGPDSSMIKDLAVQEDGKVVVVGVQAVNFNAIHFAVVRYHANGTLDTSFDHDGILLLDYPDDEAATGVAIQADGKILATGYSFTNPTKTMRVTRLNTDGSLDGSFNGTGTVAVPGTDMFGTFSNSVAVQANGNIVLGGNRIARLLPNGALDSSFGTNGVIIPEFGALTVLVQADGNIVMASNGNLGTDRDFYVARFEGGDEPSAPVVAAGADGAQLAGQLFSQIGSFSDADSTSWTATVNYGDGSGPQGLVLNTNKTFTLAHVYAEAGTYTITVSVQDNGGLIGNDTIEVVVTAPLAPGVQAGADGDILEGGSFNQAGSFSDPDSSSWTATVDYGDDSGTHFLTLNPDKTFLLNHAYENPGSYTITVSIEDNHGTIGSDTVTVNVAALQSPNVQAGADGDILEGETFNQAGSFSDPDSSSWTATVDYGDDSGTHFLTLNPDKTFLLNHAYENPGSYTITVSIEDNHGTIGTDTVTVVVGNVAPTVSISGPTSVVRGQLLTFVFIASDPPAPGVAEEFTYQIDWDGDGSVDEVVPGSSQVEVGHVYVSSGSFNPNVVVTDVDDGSSESSATTVVVTSWGLIADPSLAGKQALVVGGTTAGDTIRIERVDGPKWRILINGAVVKRVKPVARIIVYGQDGDDRIRVMPEITRPTLLHGDSGHDTLNGGSGGDALMGGAGNDVLKGNLGRDLLIGGIGQDTVLGGQAGDIAVGGPTAWDQNAAALSVLLNEWNSSRTYLQRVENVHGTGSGSSFAARLNGSVFLTKLASPTVFDDSHTDFLTGDTQLDVFFANALGEVHDSVIDAVSAEIVVR